MFCKIFVLCICLLINSIPAYSSEKEVVNSFLAIVNNVVEPIQESYSGENYTVAIAYRDIKAGRNIDMYYKTKNVNYNYSYNIEKTNSLISQYIGSIEMYSDKRIYKMFPTKHEAICNNDYLIRTIHNYKAYKFSYVYVDGKWMLYEITNNITKQRRKVLLPNNIDKEMQEFQIMSCEDKKEVTQ